jgi:hypothetical protein
MNRRQKILTIVALAAFSVIIALPYGRVYPGDYPHTSPEVYHYKSPMTAEEFLDAPLGEKPHEVQRVKHWTLQHHWESPRWIATTVSPAIEDVRMPLFALVVFYTGFFFLLATPRRS